MTAKERDVVRGNNKWKGRLAGPVPRCKRAFVFVYIFRRSEGGLLLKSFEAENLINVLMLFLACVRKVALNCFSVPS